MNQDLILAIAISCGIILFGAHAARRINMSLTSRFAIGTVLLALGVLLIYPLIGTGALEDHQFRYGLAVGMVGLGINQIAAPLRMRLGRPV